MTDLDTRLADWARAELAAAPDVPWPIWRETPRRGRVVAAVCAAAAVIVAVAIAVLVVRDRHSAPPAADRTDPSVLQGVTWLEPVSKVSVIFRSNHIEGSWCPFDQRYTRFDGDHLTLGDSLPGQPEVLCAPPTYPTGGQQAVDRLEQVLAGHMTWTVSGTTLTLSLADGPTVELTSQGTARLRLPGTTWVLAQFGQQYRQSTPPSRPAELIFDADGTFRMDDLCGGVAGTYTVLDDDSVFFNLTAGGTADCTTTEGSALSMAVVQVFNGRARWFVGDNKLQLTSDRPRYELVLAPA